MMVEIDDDLDDDGGRELLLVMKMFDCLSTTSQCQVTSMVR